MNALTLKDKLKLIQEIAEKNHITGYQIAKNTPLTEQAAINILSGKTKKPHASSVNSILEYLELYLVGKEIEQAQKSASDPALLALLTDLKKQLDLQALAVSDQLGQMAKALQVLTLQNSQLAERLNEINTLLAIKNV